MRHTSNSKKSHNDFHFLQIRFKSRSETHRLLLFLKGFMNVAVNNRAALRSHTDPDLHLQKSCVPLLFPGYSEDGGAQKGEVIPEHEFAVGPVCLDDENEFPPVGNQSN